MNNGVDIHMNSKEGLRVLEKLSNELLMDAKINAVKLNLDSDFMKILDEEIERRSWEIMRKGKKGPF